MGRYGITDRWVLILVHRYGPVGAGDIVNLSKEHNLPLNLRRSTLALERLQAEMRLKIADRDGFRGARRWVIRNGNG